MVFLSVTLLVERFTVFIREGFIRALGWPQAVIKALTTNRFFIAVHTLIIICHLMTSRGFVLS